MPVPAVSIIMPVYNAESFLRESVESVLHQTFTDFELIIIDDGSTDGSAKILGEYAKKDSRIRIIHNASNLKIAESLNRGIAAARAPLLARMDADDVCLPQRLEKQYEFMCANPDITVCGSALRIYADPAIIWRVPAHDQAIRAMLLFESCLYHPTVMMRKETLLKHSFYYDTTMPPTEDYDLWVRMAKEPQVRFANINTPLLRYRVDNSPVRSQYHLKQHERAVNIRIRQMHGIGLAPSSEEISAHMALVNYHTELSWDEFAACRKWSVKLYRHAIATGYYQQKALRQELQQRWLKLYLLNRKSIAAHLAYWTSRFSMPVTVLQMAANKLKRKCLCK